MSDVIKIKAMSLETSPAFSAYTGVILWYDEENAYKSGDESGRVLETTCPWGTQEMADNILAEISGYVYRPFTATGAFLDPAAELGDVVVVGGVCSIVATMDTTFDAMCASDISAPTDEEIETEISYVSPTDRAIKRKVTLGKSYHGTTIDRANGMQIQKTAADGTVSNRAILNSDTLAFYDADGNPSIYFDAETGKYNFYGDVTVTGGSININNNFVVDAYGNVKMSGVIEWGDYSPYKSQFSVDGETDWHATMTDDDYYRRDSYDGGTTWGAAYKFRGEDGSDANIPSYIKSTYISKTEIQSPTITGNEIRALGSFQVGYGSADDFTGTGFMGYAEGLGAGNEVTYGVALSNTESLAEGDNYVIVTDGGARMQGGYNNIFVSPDVVGLVAASGKVVRITVGTKVFEFKEDGLYIDGTKIA